MGTPDAEGHGPPEGLPDLPAEWGRVVVPDDASALAREAAQVRRELRRAARPTLRRSGLGLPVLILLVAMLTTLAGLVAVTWPRSTRSTDRPAPAPYSPPAALIGRPLPALDLVDAGQSPVPLRGLLPTMIILVDACACPDRVAEAAGAAPPGVTVVTVTHARAVPATVPAGGTPVRALADPTDGLRAFLRLPPRPGRAGAVLVDRAGVVVTVLPDLGPVETYRADLARLAA
ncbi:hypothetical protein [Micromonospora sp. WMMD812]|uniref:hypothetical protein n=1 Tax=Micromonospora sp. WMMD812 TaxID=3015152 RepID=UPI00248C5D69|nr:hypothetical protein [Micromonospora sp. WMMD812]WBB66078.1 hypothetical protein O7603_23310 [Micromonospora sp. WMMD812]